MGQSALAEQRPPGARRAALAAAATAAAGVLHVGAAVPHVADDLLVGIGFVIVGWLQLALAALLLTHASRRPVVLGVIAIHLASIGAWAMSRTVGLPLGHPGVDPVALPDALTVLLEVVGIGLAAWSLRRPVAARPQPPVLVASLATMSALAVAGSVVGVAELGQMEAGGSHGHGDEPARATEESDGERAADAIPGTVLAGLHEHDDDLLHVHDARDPHVHEDGLVHFHNGADQDAGDAGDGEGHTHAPGQDH